MHRSSGPIEPDVRGFEGLVVEEARSISRNLLQLDAPVLVAFFGLSASSVGVYHQASWDFYASIVTIALASLGVWAIRGQHASTTQNAGKDPPQPGTLEECPGTPRPP